MNRFLHLVILFSLPLGLGAAILVSFSGVAAQTNLLTNGSFETGDLTAWETTPGADISAYYAAGAVPDGDYAMLFDWSAGDPFEFAHQTFGTTVGVTYTIVMSYNNRTTPSSGVLVVLDGGAGSGVGDFSSTAATDCDDYFCHLEIEFEAIHTQTRIKLNRIAVYGDFQILIDNIQVYQADAAPTPTATPTITPTATITSTPTPSATVPAGVCVSVDNVLPNGCFETGDFTGWFGGLYSEITTTETHDGTYAAVLFENVVSGSASAVLSTDDYLSVQGGSTYDFSFWYKNITPTGANDFFVRITDSESVLYETIFVDTSGCVDWCQFSTSVFSIRTDIYIQFFDNNSDGFEFYIDEIALVRQTNPTPTPQPTATPFTIEFPTPQYQIYLPSNGVADIHMTATAGEVGIMVGLFSLSSIGTFVVLRDTAKESSKHGTD